jgi:eukaryotic-like serine/threonine-protein kinase
MLPASTRLGPYEILAPLGAGGMGEVYRARDTRLQRDVAIKVLPKHLADDPDRGMRFEREARAVAALSHPNIIAIHDVGAEGPVVYAVMELLDGETLGSRLRRGRLPLRKAVDVGAAIAEGLAAAHARGIVHRDLKPENIFLTADGRVKLLDFGLARMPEPTPPASGATRTTPGGLTVPGMTMGTAGYMAPEQVRGEAVDARSDVFALGCVLSEMVTGEPAFVRETVTETLSAILHGEPAGLAGSSPGVPRSLGQVIRRCLAKDPVDRFQSTSDLPFAIRSSIDVDAEPAPAAGRRVPGWVWPVAAALLVAAGLAVWFGRGATDLQPIRSVAVLPFDNAGGDPATEYLGDGLADHIIHSLTAARGADLRVRPFASVARYRGAPVDTAAVARELSVDALVLGSVRQNGDDLSISVSLVDAREDAQIWGHRYPGKLSDILNLQDAFARDVAANLRLRLTDEEERRLVRRDTDDHEAYLLYRQGVHELMRFSVEGLEAARDYFQRASQRDPNYVSAIAGVARTYILLGSVHLGPRATHPEAKRLLARAQAIDRDHAEVRVQQGAIHLFHDWDWDAAEQALDPARALAPELVMPALNLYGFLLAARGDAPGALDAIQRGNAVEPLSAPRRAELAMAWLWMRDAGQAMTEAGRAIELNPRFALAYHHLGFAQVHEGLFDEAAATFEKGVALAPQSAELRGGLAVAHAGAGRRAAAAAIIEDLETWSPRANRAHAIARVHAALGQHDEALRWLRQSADDRDTNMIWTGLDFMFDTLRKDPRYDDLIRAVGLPDAR